MRHSYKLAVNIQISGRWS